MPESTLVTDQDAYVDQATPDTNTGTETSLFVQSEEVLGNGENRRTFCGFDLNDLPAEAEAITSATLRLTPVGQTNGRALRCHEVTGAWTEGGITWNNQPAVDTDHGTESSSDATHEWDVTSTVQAAFPDSRVAFRVRDDVEGETIEALQEYGARESTNQEPELIVTYETSNTADLSSTVDVAHSRPYRSGRELTLSRSGDSTNPDIKDLMWDETGGVMWALDRLDDNSGADLLFPTYDRDGVLGDSFSSAGDGGLFDEPVASAIAGDDLIVIEGVFGSQAELFRFTIDRVNKELTFVSQESFGRSEDPDGISYDEDNDTWWISWADAGLEEWNRDLDTKLSTLENVNVDGIAVPKGEDFILGMTDDSAKDIVAIDKSDGSEVFRFDPSVEPDFPRPIGLWDAAWLGRIWYMVDIDQVALLTSISLASSVTPVNINATAGLASQVQPSNIDAATDLNSQATARVGAHSDLSSSVTVRQAATDDLSSVVTVELSATADLNSQVQPSNIDATADLDSQATAKVAAEADLSSWVTVRQAATDDLSSVVTAQISAITDLDSQATAKVAAEADLSSSVTMRQAATDHLSSVVTAQVSAPADLDSQVTTRVAAESHLSSWVTVRQAATDDLSSMVAAQLSATAGLVSQVKPGVGAEADLSSQVTARPTAEADLSSSVTMRQAATDDLSSVVTVELSATADLESQVLVEINAVAYLDAQVTTSVAAEDNLASLVSPALAAYDNLDSQVKPNVGAESDLSSHVTPEFPVEVDLASSVTIQVATTVNLSSSVEPTLIDVTVRGRVAGQIVTTLLVDEDDFGDISGEAGSSIAWTQAGVERNLRRVVQLIPTQSAASFPREATSLEEQSSTQDVLRRGDAILYAVDGDTVRPGDTVLWQQRTWEVIGGLGWELVGDVRVYQEVGLRRLPITTQGRTQGIVQLSTAENLLSEVNVNVP